MAGPQLIRMRDGISIGPSGKALTERFARDKWMPNGFRMLIAVLVAPPLALTLVATIPVAIFSHGVMPPGSMGPLGHAGGAVLFCLYFGALYGIPFMATFGLVAHWALLRFGLTTWMAYILAGLSGGILGSLLLGVLPSITEMVLFVLPAGLAGLLVWLIRRPDRDYRETSVSE